MTGKTPKPVDASKNYADYLDKEMSIMGILSTFCVIAVGGCITALSNVAKEYVSWFSDFWHQQGPFIFLGMTAVLTSAFCFYRQRSHLAYYVGQIYLSSFDANLVNGSLYDLHRQADRWSTWIYYRQAFACLLAAAALIGRVGLMEVLPGEGSLARILNRYRAWELWAPPLLCAIFCVLVWVTFNAYPDEEDHPYIKFLLHPKRFEKELAG